MPVWGCRKCGIEIDTPSESWRWRLISEHQQQCHAYVDGEWRRHDEIRSLVVRL